MAFNGCNQSGGDAVNQFALLDGVADEEVEYLIHGFTAEERNQSTANGQRSIDHEKGEGKKGKKGKGRGQELEKQQENNRLVASNSKESNGYVNSDPHHEGGEPKHKEERHDNGEGEAKNEEEEGWQVIRRRKQENESRTRLYFGQIPSDILIGGERKRNNGGGAGNWRRKENGSSRSVEGKGKEGEYKTRRRNSAPNQLCHNNNNNAKTPSLKTQTQTQKANPPPNSSQKGDNNGKPPSRKGDYNGKPPSQKVCDNNTKPPSQKQQDNNLVSKRDNTVAHVASRESEMNKRPLKTLRMYEEQRKEERKGLESLKSQPVRVVTLDKDFESMHIIDKKSKQESDFQLQKVVKNNKITMDKNGSKEDSIGQKKKETILNSEGEKVKKKNAMDKNGKKPLVTIFKPDRPTYYQEKWSDRRRGGSEEEKEDLRRVKRAEAKPPSYEEYEELFPALELA